MCCCRECTRHVCFFPLCVVVQDVFGKFGLFLCVAVQDVLGMSGLFPYVAVEDVLGMFLFFFPHVLLHRMYSASLVCSFVLL